MRIRYTFLLAAVLAGGVFFLSGCDNGGANGELVASFERLKTGDLTVEFKDRSRNPGGTVAERSWTFGDDSTATGANPTHTYESQGTYTVTLTVEGNGGQTASTSREINVGVPGTQQFEVTVTNVGEVTPITKSGTFGGPIPPNDDSEFTFTVGSEELPGTGTALSLATMFIQSNDAFYAFDPSGIPLFTSTGAPVGIDGPVNVTDQVALWDAGTEVDQAPGAGDNQPPPADTSSGPSENGKIVEIADLDGDDLLEDPQPSGDSLEYPAVDDVIDVTVESREDPQSGGYEFTVTVENVSAGTQVNGSDIVLSRGTYAAHFDQVPGGDPENNPEDDVRYPGFISADDSTASAGLEFIAEAGDPSVHADELDDLTGISVPLSPGVYAAHSSAVQLFSLNREASDGLEDIAEDGTPGTLAGTLDGAGDVTDAGHFGEGPLPPTLTGADSSLTFTVFATEPDPDEDVPGDRLSIATMHIQSNDYFYAFDPVGLPLFDANGDPISGSVTNELTLYDAQTEQDQDPGVGVNQAPRQPNPDTGPEESGTVVEEAPLPAGNDLFDVIEVTVTPVN